MVFDVDGTLYDPSPMRLQMARKVLWSALVGGEAKLPLIIRSLRRERERLAEAEQDGFEQRLFDTVAARYGLTAAQVRAIHDHWFDDLPLALLGRHAAPAVKDCFAALRRAEILIGVLSDHKADRKLAALGLDADIIVSAADVGVQKPHPRGLEAVIAKAGCAPHEAVMIGDRRDRDGTIAERAGTHFLLRAPAPRGDFFHFNDAVFHALVRS